MQQQLPVTQDKDSQEISQAITASSSTSIVNLPAAFCSVILPSSLPPAMLLVYAISATVAGAIVWTAWPGSSLFSFHPSFMAVGFLGAMTSAILQFTSAKKETPYEIKKWRHFYLNVVASVCALAGFLAIYANKNLNDKPHFTSWHGQLGLAVTVMVVMQTAVSSVLLYPKWMLDNLGSHSYGTFRSLHRYASVGTYSLVCAEIVLSFFTKFWTKNVDGLLWQVCTAGVIIVPALIALRVLRMI